MFILSFLFLFCSQGGSLHWNCESDGCDVKNTQYSAVPLSVRCLKPCRKPVCSGINDATRVSKFLQVAVKMLEVQRCISSSFNTQTTTISVFRDTSHRCKLMVWQLRGNARPSLRAVGLQGSISGTPRLRHWAFKPSNSSTLCAGNDLHLASLIEECVQFWGAALTGETGAISKRVDGTAAAVIYLDWATRPHLMPVAQMKSPSERRGGGSQSVMVGS